VPRQPRGAAARIQLIDCESLPTPDTGAILRRVAAEALILQDQAEAVLAGIANGDQLGIAAPRGGPLIRRFFALADELPSVDGPHRQRQLAESLRTILIHHAMQLSTALDFLAVSWRSDTLAQQVARIGGLGEPAELLEAYYRELREIA
jgi:hypothetical protein